MTAVNIFRKRNMYRYETQYHDMTVDRGLDPRKIPHYPINDFMQSVAGRNLAGAAWDELAALQAKGAQATLCMKSLIG